MRFSTSAIFVAVAIGAQALPQDVQPITQISDGQIQAPPATAPAGSYEVPTAPAATEVLPSVTPVPLPSVVPSSAPAPVEPSSAPAPVEPSSVYNTPVAPSVPAGTGATSAPYPISSGAVYTNGTVVPTGAPTVSTSAPAGGETSGSPQPTEGAGSGAATTFVSMGALFAGLFAFLA